MAWWTVLQSLTGCAIQPHSRVVGRIAELRRQRMIDDMVFRNMSPNSQKVYVRAIANFSAFHSRSPDKLSLEDVRTYRGHLIGRGLKASSISRP